MDVCTFYGATKGTTIMNLGMEGIGAATSIELGVHNTDLNLQVVLPHKCIR